MTTHHSSPASAAVIYCRVSSATQSKKGDGLASQEVRCREYAKYKGYLVLNVFSEHITGSGINRPAMSELLKFLRSRKKHGTVVIIDDISRFALDVIAHWHLRADLEVAGGVLESPSIEFKSDSHSRFVETVLAGGAQYQREKNAEQTRDRMRSRVMNGYFPFAAPISYRHAVVSGHQGKLLVRNEPLASIIQEALEGYASGRFQSQSEIKRYFETQPAFPKNADGLVRYQYVTDILRSPVYAGYVEARTWGIGLREGKHEGLIALAMHERIQRRMTEASKAPARADTRGFRPAGFDDVVESGANIAGSGFGREGRSREQEKRGGQD